MKRSALRKDGDLLLQFLLDPDTAREVDEIVDQLDEEAAPQFDFEDLDQQLVDRTVVHDDCLNWLARQPHHSIEAVVTDPPYGLLEYSPAQQEKLRNGRGGVWRIPPSFDGHKRSPLPRFHDAERRRFKETGKVLSELG